MSKFDTVVKYSAKAEHKEKIIRRNHQMWQISASKKKQLRQDTHQIQMKQNKKILY